jgi:hypothetical protein
MNIAGDRAAKNEKKHRKTPRKAFEVPAREEARTYDG